jgi:hypothetical protein
LSWRCRSIDVNHVRDLGWTALLEAVILGDGGPGHQQIGRLPRRCGSRDMQPLPASALRWRLGA